MTSRARRLAVVLGILIYVWVVSQPWGPKAVGFVAAGVLGIR